MDLTEWRAYTGLGHDNTDTMMDISSRISSCHAKMELRYQYSSNMQRYDLGSNKPLTGKVLSLLRRMSRCCTMLNQL